MRLTPKDPGASTAFIMLDGTPVLHCTRADSDHGFVDALVLDGQGGVQPNDANTGPRIQRLYGRVNIAMRGGALRRWRQT